MKKEILINSDKRHVLVQVHAATTLLATGTAGEETQDAANAEKLRVSAKLVRAGVTGAYVLKEGAQAKPFYLIEDGVIKFAMMSLPFGYNRLTVVLQYGTNEPSVLVADINVLPDATTDEWYVHDEYDFNAVKTVGGAGGGQVDYKTDVYMDGAGRVIVERGDDGSTLILDEHENPILKRLADGSTQYFDAYQSARLLMDAHGEVSINDHVAGTLKIAEAILARATKHLLTYNGTNIKEGDTIMTHSSLYEMLMSTPAFVVLVYNDHAYHPNLVTSTQIAFTCSYFSTNDEIVVERVNITSANVITTTIGKTKSDGLALNSRGGLEFGSGSQAGANGAFSHGATCKANSNYAHAEGLYCTAGSMGSHSEGYDCLANGEHAHAEGSSTQTTSNDQHSQGKNNYYEECRNIPGAFMHGCGADTGHRQNAFLIVGSEIYVYGVGGYNGTNHASAQSLRQVLAAM